ncbi:MAG TPA: hybrid sensor histidine kinase/response regulator [Verrucomicrobiae bacterium]|nr:hybrid sensor histidine kinase/response regulator [Verrucomicrobiae bacterium]
MERIQAFLKVSFGTKVLVPVALCMVLLLASTVWLLNRRLAREFQTTASRTLAHAENALKTSQSIHLQDLSLRYQNLPKQPIYKAAFQYADQHDGAFPATLRGLFDDLLAQESLDVILYATNLRAAVAFSKKDPSLSITAFQNASRGAITRGLEGEEQADVVAVDRRMFYVVSIPVFVGGDHQVGALAVGSEVGNGTAEEWADITQCQIALIAGGRVVASTLGKPELNPRLLEIFNGGSSVHTAREQLKGALLDGEHYYCSTGKFNSVDPARADFGWVLLSSYEQPLQALRQTQQVLVAISSAGILGGIFIVWLLIRKVTQPLRALRDSAEAVGKGDFSCKVEVKSGDECGELAFVFNQMTENLKRSREQLEQTVDTLKTTQANLIQSEKLSGIGEFVAGVAHELNNPLTSVMGFSELLGRAEVNPKNKRHLEMIHKSALRCQKIVQSLLSFARRHAPERKLSNLNELVSNAVEFLSYQLRTSNIEVTTRLDPSMPGAMVDPHQLQQVFLNIINNARQAMEAHQSQGRIEITTEVCGQTARVTFTDNGPGISEQNLSKIFDPFFTTKEVGKGTGLGLSLCYGIVKEHGGSIQVRGKAGEGASFVIELPLPNGAASAAPAVASEPQSSEKNLPGQGKRILVIDDEEGILEILKETLSDSGYSVDTAPDGESALRRASQTSYDLALCDWKMPGLNGQQVYEKLQSSNPRLSERMIFITGDVINEKTRNFLDESKKVCLSKPFSLHEFRAVVGKAFETEAG